MNCREKLNSKLSVDAGFIYDEAPETFVMLREMKDSLCFCNLFCHKTVIFPLIKPVTNLLFKVLCPEYMCVGGMIHKAIWDS